MGCPFFGKSTEEYIFLDSKRALVNINKAKRSIAKHRN